MIRHTTKNTVFGDVIETFREMDIESRPYGFTVTLYAKGDFSPSKIEYFTDWQAVKKYLDECEECHD